MEDQQKITSEWTKTKRKYNAKVYGQCAHCGGPVHREHATHCNALKCQNSRKRDERRRVFHRPSKDDTAKIREETGLPPYEPAEKECRRCGQTFMAEDKKLFWLCPTCRQYAENVGD